MADLDPKLNAILVHAMVSGTGKAEGIRFSHAWVEIGDVVFDNSNNKNSVIRKEQYYRVAQVNTVDAAEYHQYNYEETLINGVKHGHYGPWDID